VLVYIEPGVWNFTLLWETDLPLKFHVTHRVQDGFELTISDQDIHFMLCIVVVSFANCEMVDFCHVTWKGENRFFWIAVRVASWWAVATVVMNFQVL